MFSREVTLQGAAAAVTGRVGEAWEGGTAGGQGEGTGAVPHGAEPEPVWMEGP